MCWALIHCFESIFSSKTPQQQRVSQQESAPLTVNVTGPDSNKLIEISNAINKQLRNNSIRIFSQVNPNASFYQVLHLLAQITSTKGSKTNIIYRGSIPAQSDLYEAADRLTIEARNWFYQHQSIILAFLIMKLLLEMTSATTDNIGNALSYDFWKIL